MSRFDDSDDFEDDDDQFNYENDFDDSNISFSGAVPTDMLNNWKLLEVSLEERQINYKVLKQVIKMLEKSWFWRFRSLQSQIRMIYDAYHALSNLVTIEE